MSPLLVIFHPISISARRITNNNFLPQKVRLFVEQINVQYRLHLGELLAPQSFESVAWRHVGRCESNRIDAMMISEENRALNVELLRNDGDVP